MQSAPNIRVHAGASVALALLAAAGCSSVIGLDDLVYDREPSGAGGSAGTGASTGDVASSGTTTTTDASAGSTTPEASSSSGEDGGAGPTSNSASTGEGGAGAGGTGGAGGAGGAAPTCNESIGGGGATAYREMMLNANGAYYRLNEREGDFELEDSKYEYEANLQLDGGAVGYELPGAFDDDTAMSFAGGAHAEVPFQDPFWDHDWDETDAAFTVTFFAKLTASPEAPVVVAQCYDQVENLGWIVEIDSEVRIRLYGRDAGGDPAADTIAFSFPADGCWHHVTLFRPSGTTDLRGYRDGVQAVGDDQAFIVDMLPHSADLFIGAAPDAGADTPTLALDELTIIPFGLNDAQIARQSECLMGGSCAADPF